MTGSTSSGPTEDQRVKCLYQFEVAIGLMLDEKKAQYGQAGGFYETNQERDYGHALGEARLKLQEYAKTKKGRILIKAATWIYLIYETEALGGTTGN